MRLTDELYSDYSTFNEVIKGREKGWGQGWGVGGAFNKVMKGERTVGGGVITLFHVVLDSPQDLCTVGLHARRAIDNFRSNSRRNNNNNNKRNNNNNNNNKKQASN